MGSRNGANLILVVEDEFDLYDLVTTALELDPSVETVRAKAGERALEMARTLRPDVVVLDVRPPRLSGLKVAKRLKADSETSAIPRVAVTSEPPSVATVRACDYCVTRPYDVARVVERLRDNPDVAA